MILIIIDGYVRVLVVIVIDTFWCSALVTFMYVGMGWFPENLDWTDKTPADLARIKCLDPIHLGDICRYN